MKLEPSHLESVVIDPRAVADNGVGDDAWSEEEFEASDEEEEEDEEEDDDEQEDDTEQDNDEEEEVDDEDGGETCRVNQKKKPAATNTRVATAAKVPDPPKFAPRGGGTLPAPLVRSPTAST